MDQIVPKDILLPLPAPVWLLVTLLLVSFALHILFVNLMVGGSLMVLISEIRGLKNKDWDEVSHRIAATITVNKSMAVVLGVAPLLTISVLYTPQFYSANALLGFSWLMVIPLVILAFLFSYAHEYSWERLAASKGVHIALAAIAAALFLAIPFIFLANINLMLYPERWPAIRSFWDAIWLPNVLPRYLHFIAASLAVTGLFLVFYFRRPRLEVHFGSLERSDLLRSFYGVSLAATGAQVVLGLLLFLTLPAHVLSLRLVALLLVAVALVPAALLWLWREVREVEPGSRRWRLVAVLAAVVCVMIVARHEVRETAVKPHRALVAAKTADYKVKLQEARDYLVMPGGLGGAPASPGAQVFTRRCTSCHAFDRKLVGPPLAQALGIYRGNRQALMSWITKPGRKRPDFPVMPAQEMPPDELQQLVDYLLENAG